MNEHDRDIIEVFFNERPFEVERLHGRWAVSVNWMRYDSYDWVCYYVTDDPETEHGEKLFDYLTGNPMRAWTTKWRWWAAMWARIWNRAWKIANA